VPISVRADSTSDVSVDDDNDNNDYHAMMRSKMIEIWLSFKESNYFPTYRSHRTDFKKLLEILALDFKTIAPSRHVKMRLNRTAIINNMEKCHPEVNEYSLRMAYHKKLTGGLNQRK
jgi:hypothetical protein